MTDDHFPYHSVWEYLEEQGVLEKDDETIKAAKKKYWKMYKKAYGKWYSREYPGCFVRFTSDEFDEVSEQASREEIKPQTFIRNAVFWYLANSGQELISSTDIDNLQESLRAVLSRSDDMFTKDELVQELASLISRSEDQEPTIQYFDY